MGSQVEVKMPGRCFLATYRPLVMNSKGQHAIRQFDLPPFIDGSCRREPDFESAFPSITATCRAGHFAPRLVEGDRIAYLTVKGKYLDDLVKGQRLVAVLRVVKRFESHDEAADWYKEQNQPPPSNCFVHGNAPKPFERTNGNPPKEVKEQLSSAVDLTRAIRLWDWTYRKRVSKYPVFLATVAEFLDLIHPPQILEAHICAIFGNVPSTLNPPRKSCEQIDQLQQLAVQLSAHA